jgi:type IV pilus assembly protein PilM
VAKQMLTIYLSDTVMRIMTTDGKQIYDWAELQFEPGLIDNNVIVDEDAVVERIKQFLELHSISTRRVMVGISGIRCLTRPVLLPKLPGEILDEAVRREAERLLPVSLDDLYLAWQSIPAPEGKTQVFLTAIPRRTMDPLMSVLDKVGLKPDFMDLKPLLLARISKEETAILVDVQDVDFDIVIMVNGVPQPIRTIPFPSENPNREEKLDIIREELDRTITFYNSNNPDSAIDTGVPVYMSGKLEDEAESCRMLSEEINREVVMFPSPMETPDGFNPSLYMANIGLVLQVVSSGKSSGPSVVNLNTIPAEYRPQPVSSLNILKMLGIAFAVILVAGLGFLFQDNLSSISAKQSALESARTLLEQSQQEVMEVSGKVKELKSQVAEMETERQNFTAALGTLELQSISLNRDLEETMETVPGSIILTGLTHEGGALTISGIAPSEQTVKSFISKLSSTGRFAGNIEIQEMAIREDGTMAFTITGNLLIDTDWVSSIEVILGNLPSSIMLEFAATAQDILTLTGNSPDEDRLMYYLEKLDDSGKFSVITIDSIYRIEDGSLDFSIALKIGE